MAGPFLRSRALAAVALLILAACGRAPEPLTRLPLVDAGHAPDVVTEAADLALPPSVAANRFLSGWFPWRDGERVVLSPEPAGARLEVARLADRPRTLVLDLLDGAPLGGRAVRVRAGERSLGPFPLADPLRIPLPGGMPLGRAAVDLIPEGGTSGEPMPGVVAAAVAPALPAGRVAIEGGDVVQAGASLVDFAREAEGIEELTGSFVPPEPARPGQSFELAVERSDGSAVRRFTWSSSFWNRLRGRRGIRLPLRGSGDLVRVRLLALGEGPPARWQGLALHVQQPPAPPPASQRPAASREPPRVVVLYVMDALRADRVGYLGGPPRASPTFDRLAREGIACLHHRTPAPNTLPSTKTLFTGRAFVSRGGWKLLPEDGPTLAARFRAAGYRTGLFSGNVYVSPAYGTDRGFEHAAGEVLIEGYSAKEKPPFNDNAARVHAAALAWLRSLPAGSRAFLYLHTIHPHNPYDPPEPFRSRWAGAGGKPGSRLEGDTATILGIKQGRIEADEAGRERLRGLYTGGFAYNDHELGRFLAELRSLAPPEEVLLALTADHGEELFDHGGVLHGYTLYEELLRIPLVLWSPGRLAPRRVEEPTDTRDLHATLVDLCGLREPAGRPAASEGRSLLSLPGRRDPRPLHFAAASSVKGGIYSVQSPRWKLVWAPRTGIGWGMGEGLGRGRDAESLFDLAADPGERTNSAGRGDLEAAWLRSRLLAWIARARPEGETSEPAVDRETLDRLRALGYVN